MANEKISQLPTVSSALLADIFPAVQGGTTVQESLQQVFTTFLANTILNYAGNPNGNVAGVMYQLCWDTSDTVLYICTTGGNAATAVWSAVSQSASSVVTPAHGGTGVASPTAHTLPVAEGASNFTFLGPLTNGQLLIGSTGNNPTPATLTAGTNISISNSAGGITINAAGDGSFSWNHITGTTQTMASFNGYVPDNVSAVTLTLPATSNFGDEIAVAGKGSGGWIVQATGSQTIVLGSSTTTGGGALASTNAKDSFRMVCTVANLEWTVLGAPQGNLTVS